MPSGAPKPRDSGRAIIIPVTCIQYAWDTPVNDHVSSYTFPRDLMTSSDGRIILGADGTFLLSLCLRCSSKFWKTGQALPCIMIGSLPDELLVEVFDWC